MSLEDLALDEIKERLETLRKEIGAVQGVLGGLVKRRSELEQELIRRVKEEQKQS